MLFAAAARLILPSKLGELGRGLVILEPSKSGALGLAGLEILFEIVVTCCTAVTGLSIILGPGAAGIAATVAGFILSLIFFLEPCWARWEDCRMVCR